MATLTVPGQAPKPSTLSPQGKSSTRGWLIEIAQSYQNQKAGLQALLSKVGELESDADEHKLVLETLTEVKGRDPARVCYRMINGVLVKRTVADVEPELLQRLESIKQMIQSLSEQIVSSNTALQTFAREHRIEERRAQ